MSVSEEVKQLRLMLEAHIADAKRTQRSHIQHRERQAEVLDPVPLEGAVSGPPGPPSMTEQIKAYIREAVSEQADEEDLGTFAQEDDFEEESPDLLTLSGFEVTDYEMEPEYPVEDSSPPPESPQVESKEGTPTTGTPTPDPPASVPPTEPPTLTAEPQ